MLAGPGRHGFVAARPCGRLPGGDPLFIASPCARGLRCYVRSVTLFAGASGAPTAEAHLSSGIRASVAEPLDRIGGRRYPAGQRLLDRGVGARVNGPVAHINPFGGTHCPALSRGGNAGYTRGTTARAAAQPTVRTLAHTQPTAP